MQLIGFPERAVNTLIYGLRGRIERRIPFASSRSIDWIQTARLRRIVDRAYRFVPFYREAMRAVGLRREDIRHVEDLARLPLIDGTALRQHAVELVSQRPPRDQLLVIYSTGTVRYGTKSVLWERGALLSQVAHGERDRSILRELLGTSGPLVRLSFFHPESSTSAVTRAQTERLLVPRRLWTTHWGGVDLGHDDVARMLDRLRPDVAYSYGSFAEAFLLHVHDRGWTVHLPKVWVFGGDGVREDARRTIEDALPCRLYSTYQAVEAGRIGFECEEDSGYHINTDLCHVRLVDAQGETAPRGTVGEVVLSNLYNEGTVLLNYRLGDRAVWDDCPCPCGRTLPVLRLTGARASETLRLRDGRVLQKHVLLHACKAKMHDVLQFRIVETAPEEITWRVVASQRADRAALVGDLVSCSRSALSDDADVRVEFVDRLTSNGSKLTHIVRFPSPDTSSGRTDEQP